jgi:hypothetical protein
MARNPTYGVYNDKTGPVLTRGTLKKLKGAYQKDLGATELVCTYQL